MSNSGLSAVWLIVIVPSSSRTRRSPAHPPDPRWSRPSHQYHTATPASEGCIPFVVAALVAGASDLRLLLIDRAAVPALTTLSRANFSQTAALRSLPGGQMHVARVFKPWTGTPHILARRANERCQDRAGRLTRGDGTSAARGRAWCGSRSPCRARIRLDPLPGFENPGNARAPYRAKNRWIECSRACVFQYRHTKWDAPASERGLTGHLQ